MYSAILGMVVAIIAPFFAGTGDGILSAIAYVLGLLTALAGSTVAWATWRETARKPGSTPMIYSVIAIPVGVLALPLLAFVADPATALYAVLVIITGVIALVGGLVKKLATPA